MDTRTVGLWVVCTCVLLISSTRGQRYRGLQPPTLTSSLPKETYFRQEKDQIVLECLAEGIPTPSYIWKRTVDSGTPEERTDIIVASSMFSIRGGRLTISNPVVNSVPKAEGLYQCFASNGHGTAMSQEVDVRYAFLGKFPSAPPKNTRATQGEYVMLPCTYAPQSNPAPPTYSWTKVGGEVQKSSRIAVDLDGNLHIINAERGDEQAAGRVYNCSVYNPVSGSKELGASVILAVTAQTPANRAPQIAFHKAEVIGMLGDKAELQCIPNGYPIPEIIWRDPPTGRSRVEDFTRSLIIFALEESDDQTYTCEARSSGEPSGRTTVRLKVRSPPIWEEKPEAQTVPEGETATFKCAARGTHSDTERVTVQWYKDGVALRYGANVYNIYINGSELTVRNLVKPDYLMNIQCKVSNSWGSDIADGALNVIIPTKILVVPKDVVLNEDGKVAWFKVNAEVDPLKTSELKYVWKKPNGEEVISTNKDDSVYQLSDGSLVVNTTKLAGQEYNDHLGNYTCTVSVGVPRADKVLYATLKTTDTKPICPVWMLGPCPGEMLCLHGSQLCNGYNDCTAGTDEQNCIHGLDCNYASCTRVFTPLAQIPGSFNVRKFEQGCSLFPTASTCMESKMRRCTVTKSDRFDWELVSDMTQSMCNEKRAAYLEVAPCMNTKERFAALERCTKKLKSGGRITCSLLRAHLGCVTNSVKSCGEKAVDVTYTVTYNAIVSRLKYEGIDGCSLGSTAARTTNTGGILTVICCFVSALFNLYF